MRKIRIGQYGPPENLPVSDGSLTVTIPIQIKRRGGYKSVTLPDGGTLEPRRSDKPLTPIQRALVRSYQWLAILESGKVRTLTELAEKKGLDRAYVSRLMNLTTLAPDIIADILDETLPSEITLFDLASGTPILWEDQRDKFVRK